MREIVKGVFLQESYPGVRLGAVVADGAALLVDSPLRIEDGREWLAEIGSRGRPRFLVLLDDHPDRVYGARSFDLSLIAQTQARDPAGTASSSISLPMNPDSGGRPTTDTAPRPNSSPSNGACRSGPA